MLLLTRPCRARWIGLAIAIASSTAATGASGQDAKLPAVPVCAPLADGQPEYLGFARCVACHRLPLEPDRVFAKDFCILNESEVFTTKDKHADAWNLINNDAGRKIWDQVREPGDQRALHEARECLTCHAGWRADAAAEHQRPVDLDFGVSCEACHGPSARWFAAHATPAWRLKPQSDKEKDDCRMFDVRSLVRRAELCYSCHIGNVEQKRVVTHDMYAAGHPPLPAVELQSWGTAMPAHWRNLREKGDFLYRAEYVKRDFPHLVDRDGNPDLASDLPETRAMLVGGVMALRESLRLLASQADAKTGPEFAVFDCQACHHELTSDSWRQQRYLKLGPDVRRRTIGKPQIPEWTAALVRAALSNAASDANSLQNDQKDLDDRMLAVRDAFRRNAFGDPKTLRAAILDPGGLSDWLAAKAQAVATSKLDRPRAEAVIQSLARGEPNRVPDFHTARQIAWAIWAVRKELESGYPQFESRKHPEALDVRVASDGKDLDVLREWREGPQANAAAALEEAFQRAELTSQLALKLPAGQKGRVMEPERMKAALKAMGDYDPGWFEKQILLVAPNGR